MGKMITEVLYSCGIARQEVPMDTRKVHGVDGLIDCGADGKFLDSNYVHHNNILAKKLSVLILVNNVDGSPNKSKPITEVADLILHYQGHSKGTIHHYSTWKQENDPRTSIVERTQPGNHSEPMPGTLYVQRKFRKRDGGFGHAERVLS